MCWLLFCRRARYVSRPSRIISLNFFRLCTFLRDSWRYHSKTYEISTCSSSKKGFKVWIWSTHLGIYYVFLILIMEWWRSKTYKISNFSSENFFNQCLYVSYNRIVCILSNLWPGKLSEYIQYDQSICKVFRDDIFVRFLTISFKNV